ncbi:hypothetical protein FHS96_004931 [Sphingomonas zeicaulis]|uniref:endonuclease/exonuclease/phosphatase family protein n=1 Tax=Sphingomonas zeicaulis TaxID=1632740 RepID=UPI003D20F345
MPTVITWNTQGDPTTHPGKAAELATMCAAYDYVLLQECGHMKLWNGNKYMYSSYQAGAFNSRCSTAILSNAPADVKHWTGSSSGRSGLYMNVAGTIIGTIHATSGGVGMGDVTPFLKTVSRLDAQAIVIGGDFNAELAQPFFDVGTSNRPNTFDIVSQGGATHQGGLCLDYFFYQGTANPGNATLYPTQNSDHDAVWMTF